jgi:hypothetical protein
MKQMTFSSGDIVFLVIAIVFAVVVGLFFAPVTKWLERFSESGKKSKN